MAVKCGAITTDPATKKVCLEVFIDNENEKPVQVTFQVCQETVSASSDGPESSSVGNLLRICAHYTVGPGMCVITATASGAAGGSCFTQQVLPV